MRRISRVVTVAMLLIGVAPLVAGCADGDFDMDKLDVLGLNKKKPLPGKREALFPNGVPGVEQGIPPEYMKGNLAQQAGAAVPVGPLTQPAGAQTASAAPPAEEAKEKPVVDAEYSEYLVKDEEASESEEEGASGEAARKAQTE